MDTNVRSTLRISSALALLVAGLFAVRPARAADSACEALTVADIGSLGFDAVKPGSAHEPNRVVNLDSNAAISGRQTECLWQTGHGSVTLILGDFDANLVKGDDVRRLGQKVLGSVRKGMEDGAVYSGNPYSFSPLPGVGEEAFAARATPLFFEVVARKGLRLARLRVSASPGIPRTPTPEQAGGLVNRVFGGGGGYTTAGAPSVKGEEPWAGPGDRYVVTGSIVATGALSGTFVWSSPNAVETYPDRTEIVLATADKKAFLNLQVFAAEDRVVVTSGKLHAGKLTGKGRTSKVDALKGSGVVTVDSTVRGGNESVTLRGTLTIQPAKR
jgi:hypothetical protein